MFVGCVTAKTWRRKRTGERALCLIGGRFVKSMSKSFGVVDVGMAEIRPRSATSGDFMLERPRFERLTAIGDFADRVPGCLE